MESHSTNGHLPSTTESEVTPFPDDTGQIQPDQDGPERSQKERIGLSDSIGTSLAPELIDAMSLIAATNQDERQRNEAWKEREADERFSSEELRQQRRAEVASQVRVAIDQTDAAMARVPDGCTKGIYPDKNKAIISTTASGSYMQAFKSFQDSCQTARNESALIPSPGVPNYRFGGAWPAISIIAAAILGIWMGVAGGSFILFLVGASIGFGAAYGLFRLLKQQFESNWNAKYVRVVAAQNSVREREQALIQTIENEHRSRLSLLTDTIARERAEAETSWANNRSRATSQAEAYQVRVAHDAPLLAGIDPSTWHPAAKMPSYVSLGVIPRFGRADANILAVAEAPYQLTVGITSQQESRALANKYLEMYLLKLLALTPPSRIRFTLVDAVGRGQAFATFMQMIDSERREKANEETIGRRIWTEQREIEERVADLVREMETRIQQRLGNRYKDLSDYNAQAVNPLPWLVLGVANFPHGFSDDSARRLLSIAEHGRRTGVFVAFTWDKSIAPPYRFNNDALAAVVSMLHVEDESLVATVHGKWDLTPDTASTALLDAVLRKMAIEVPKASIVEIPFSKIEPTADSWQTESTRDGIAVPIGHSGASKRQIFEYSSNRSAYHGVMLGQTGSGKSMLLHVLISSLALTYSPDELQLYLIDFKEGVEFKLYAEKRLPHARVIAIRSEPEFGLSVLEGLAAELERRGELFREASETYGEVKDLSSYRSRTGTNGETLPRIMLIIDEFQVLFADDNAGSRKATQLLEHIARQGRSAGVHLLLVSQTLAGSAALSKPTLGQMSVRIALRCDDGDARLIFDEKNLAARDLIRPGEGVYNDGSGKVEANSEFQVAYLDPKGGAREELLNKVNQRYAEWATTTGATPLPLKIFEGDENADITECSELAGAFAAPYAGEAKRVVAWVGEPIAIKNATIATFRRQSRSHLLIVGQDEESARGTLEAVALSLTAQSRTAPTPARIEVMDLTPVDDDFADRWSELAGIFPESISVARRRQIGEMVTRVWTELIRRESEELTREPGRFLIINGIVRARDLKAEGGYSVNSRNGTESTPGLPQQFVKILRDGPEYGIHVITWADTLANFRRVLDRQALDEFDMRIGSQMSQDDSSQLIDSTNASKLGPHRAIFFSEEDGLMEKFRPYSPAALEWIRQLAGRQVAVEQVVGS